MLGSDANKQLAVDYQKKLSSEALISVYGFVTMPNHIHLIWKQNKLNEKETLKGNGTSGLAPSRKEMMQYVAGKFFYLATAFARCTFINDYTIPFYIVARYYQIGILGRAGNVMASYDYLVVNFQAT